MGLFRLLLLVIGGYLIFQIIKPYLFAAPKNENIKGNAEDKNDIQKKHADKIEDANFEDVE